MHNIIDTFKRIEARVDFFYGALFGAVPFCFGAGWWVLITVPICAFLYAIGGDDDYRSAWRDVGCSAVNSTCLILATGNLLFVGAGLATFGLLTVGLGLPSTNPPDAGSPVGRVAWKLAKQKEWLANIYTRVFLYSALWLIYFVCSIARGILW